MLLNQHLYGGTDTKKVVRGEPLTMEKSKVKILVVGQTPPPYHGQAIMIEKMLKFTYQNAELYHARMSFSKEIDEIGLFKFRKPLQLLTLLHTIWQKKFKYDIDVLYYPPTGPFLLPLLRDMVILLLCRPLFKKIIFHFHAGGISEYRKKLPMLLRPFFDRSYNNADMAIRLSVHAPVDPCNLKAKKEVIIPNGVDDEYGKFQNIQRKKDAAVTILFVGMVCHTKGIEDLLSAFVKIKKSYAALKLKVVGKAESSRYEEFLLQKCKDANIENQVEFLGVKTGISRFEEYFNADIFCLPSFYPAEVFPIVLLEAMSFRLPVVATNWRGIPSIVLHDQTGILVNIRDISPLAESLLCLATDTEKRKLMGDNGRKRFLENYTSTIFNQKMEEVFSTLFDTSKNVNVHYKCFQ